ANGPAAGGGFRFSGRVQVSFCLHPRPSAPSAGNTVTPVPLLARLIASPTTESDQIQVNPTKSHRIRLNPTSSMPSDFNAERRTAAVVFTIL
ncbi:MAG: hypothetical protein NTV51_17395, partial [Verrucomicrobia bacterium]|nr:hypothetical protein [Verrucomicrobiota bacterium]